MDGGEHNAGLIDGNDALLDEHPHGAGNRFGRVERSTPIQVTHEFTKGTPVAHAREGRVKNHREHALRVAQGEPLRDVGAVARPVEHDLRHLGMVEYCADVVEHVLDPHDVDRKVIALRIRAAHAHASMLHHDDVEPFLDHVAP